MLPRRRTVLNICVVDSKNAKNFMLRRSVMSRSPRSLFQ